MTLVRRTVTLLAAAVVLAACRIDVDAELTVNADGSGEVAVVATVDADVVAQAPGLAGGLALADATAVGWTVEGPAPTETGGLTVTLRHPFATVQEAANLVNSLGPPFGDLTVERQATEDEVIVTLAGTLTLPGGSWDAFGDQTLIQAAGGTPFGAQLTSAEATPASAMSISLAVRLPGEVEQRNGERRDGSIVWTAPLDGSTMELGATAVLDGGGGGGFGDTLSTIALVLLVVWLAAGLVLATLVVRARRRRRTRRLRW